MICDFPYDLSSLRYVTRPVVSYSSLMIQLTLGKSFGPGEVITHSALKEYEMKLHLTQTFSIFTAFLLLFTVPHSFPVSAVYIARLPIQRRRFNNIVLHSIDQKNYVSHLFDVPEDPTLFKDKTRGMG